MKNDYEKGQQFYREGNDLAFMTTYSAEFLNGYLNEERMSHCGFKYVDWSKVDD